MEYSPAPKLEAVPVTPVSLALDLMCYVALDAPLAAAVEDYLLPGVLRQLNGCARLLMQQSFIHQVSDRAHGLAIHGSTVAHHAAQLQMPSHQLSP